MPVLVSSVLESSSSPNCEYGRIGTGWQRARPCPRSYPPGTPSLDFKRIQEHQRYDGRPGSVHNEKSTEGFVPSRRRTRITYRQEPQNTPLAGQNPHSISMRSKNLNQSSSATFIHQKGRPTWSGLCSQLFTDSYSKFIPTHPRKSSESYFSFGNRENSLP